MGVHSHLRITHVRTRLYSYIKTDTLLYRAHLCNPIFARNAKRSETIDSRGGGEGGRSNIRNDTFMQTNERWIFFKRPRSSPLSFFGRCPRYREIPFSPAPVVRISLLLFFRIARRHFSLLPGLLFSPSLPLTVGEFFSVHLFRRSRSADCLGRYIGGLKGTIFPLFFSPSFLVICRLSPSSRIFVQISRKIYSVSYCITWYKSLDANYTPIFVYEIRREIVEEYYTPFLDK